MSVDVGIPDPPMRILTGPCRVVEAEVNRMAQSYVVTQWAFAVVNNEFHVTAIMLSQSEIRKAQLAGARMMPQRQ